MNRSRSAGGTLTTLISMVQAPTLSAGTDLLTGLTPGCVEELIQVARLHGIEAWLAACAPRNEPAWEPIALQRVRFHAARMRDSAVVDDLADVLGALDCPWAVLKGPALGQSVYPRPELRFGVDLDVLVPPSRFAEVLAVLEETAKFELLDRNWPLIDATLPGELRVRSPRGVLVDLHWSVVNTASVRQWLQIPTDQLLSAGRYLASGMPVLASGDQLIHLGVHGSLSGANKLSWLLDADLAGRQVDQWQPIINRAKSFGASAMLAVVLARAQRVWDSPVPAPVLRALAGGRLPLAVDRVVDTVSAIGLDPDDRSVSRAWARSIRTSASDSLLEVARHGVEWLRGGHLHARPAVHINVSADSRSPLHPVEDPAARERYLTTVSIQD